MISKTKAPSPLKAASDENGTILYIIYMSVAKWQKELICMMENTLKLKTACSVLLPIYALLNFIAVYWESGGKQSLL